MITMPGTPSWDDALVNQTIQKLAYKPWKWDDGKEPCSNHFRPPPVPPADDATGYNGVSLPDTCFFGDDEHHVFVIGDWGGVLKAAGEKPVPADHRSVLFASHHRPFVLGADDTAQLNVAKWMRYRAAISFPDYVISVGDNFYWGGVTVKCGAPPGACEDASGQWRWVYETVYKGLGLDLPQWLGVLGNHDFGGYMFTAGWDQAVSYTWAKLPTSTGRWLTPALYYSAKVHYDTFSVDYFFVDTNVFDAFEPDVDQGHNLCSRLHNLGGHDATCGPSGPWTVDECPKWFKRLWDAQIEWMEDGLGSSTADWQVIVTHFPPEHGADEWKRIVRRYGVDLLISGHRHKQEVHYEHASNFLWPTAYIVSGGGGGITSEGLPSADGIDDMYGFMDLTFTKEEIMIEAISHGGQTRSTTCVKPVSTETIERARSESDEGKRPSLCDGRPLRAQPQFDEKVGAFPRPVADDFEVSREEATAEITRVELRSDTRSHADFVAKGAVAEAV